MDSAIGYRPPGLKPIGNKRCSRSKTLGTVNVMGSIRALCTDQQQFNHFFRGFWLKTFMAEQYPRLLEQCFD